MSARSEPYGGTSRAARSWRRRLVGFLGEQGFIVIFLLWAVYLAFNTDNFATTNNLFTVLRQATIIGMVAIGAHFIILMGDMDLSMAANRQLARRGHGELMVITGVSAILAALRRAGDGRRDRAGQRPDHHQAEDQRHHHDAGHDEHPEGLAFILTQGQDDLRPATIDRVIKFLSSGALFDMCPCQSSSCSSSTWWRSWCCGARPSARTSSPRQQRRAAWLSGMNVDRVKVATFMLPGCWRRSAAIMQVARQGTATGGMGADFLFPILTAVVLGGASLRAGAAKSFNTLIAAIFLTTITNGMVLLNIGIYTQRLMSGVILIVALSLDRLRTLRL